jgi:flagellar secretion chaperone FliS
MNDPRILYRENAVRGASAVGLVIMLYDTAVDDLRRAIAAIHAADVETRTNEIKHALLVVQQLQGTLQMDAGESAATLDRFYSLIRAKMLEAQLKQSAAILEELIGLFLSVREAWQQVDTPKAPASAPAIPSSTLETTPSIHWSA